MFSQVSPPISRKKTIEHNYITGIAHTSLGLVHIQYFLKYILPYRIKEKYTEIIQSFVDAPWPQCYVMCLLHYPADKLKDILVIC